MALINLPPWVLALRKVLGKLTDALLVGRSAGLWSKKDGPKF